MSILPFLIAAVAVLGVIALLSVFTGSKKSDASDNSKRAVIKKQKGRAAIIHDATKKLAHDPHDPAGLIPLADLYFSENLWDKAYPLYDTMSNIAAAHREIDPYKAVLRQGICALNLNRMEDASRYLAIAYGMNSSDFDACYYYGLVCYKTNTFDKAIPCLKKALLLRPESTEAYPALALSLYKFKRYKDALSYLKKALDIEPENKELLYAMGYSLQESGYNDKALKIFMHLRPDPAFGAQASLAAGILHSKMQQLDKALQDYAIGLKHQGTAPEVMLEIKYRMAQTYFSTGAISNGLPLLKEIMTVNSRYKDVPALLTRYQELSSNSNLQVYLMASTSDFVALCRKIVGIYFPHSFTKIVDISPQSAFIEITTEIETPKWEDTAIFRFYRTTGVSGDVYVRDFYGTIHDTKAGRGVCITAGTFSDEAKKYVEGRPIDLVEKQQLITILKKIS